MIKIPTFDLSDLFRPAAGCAPSAHPWGSALASAQVSKLNDLIRGELNAALGTEEWVITDLAERVRIEKVIEYNYETYFLDNKPFLRVWPPVVETKNNGLKTVATVTQEYRTFREQNPGWARIERRPMKPTPEDRAAGIKHKYNITRADGSPVDPQGMYFVLRLDYHEGCDPRHIEACRRAARAYAAHATDNLPVLSRELLEYLDASAPNAKDELAGGDRP